MRLALFKPYKEEQWVSSEVFAKNLQAQLKASPITLKVVSPGERVLSPFLRVYRLRLLLRYLVYPFLAFFRQGDVNHILDSSYAHTAIFLDRKSTVITCHDVIPIKLFRKRTPTVKERVKLWLYRFSVGFLSDAGVIVAVSESTKQDLVRLLGIPAENIRVIYQGVHRAFKRIQNRKKLHEIQKKYRLPKRFILHVGHNYYYKNIEFILTLTDYLSRRKATADVYFVKVGPEFLPEQRRLIGKLGIADRIIRIPTAPTADLVGIYNLAMLLVHPSTFEGFGLTILEAMACGCPVVASNIPPFEELYSGSVRMVSLKRKRDFLETVFELINDHRQRILLGRKGRVRAEHFRWEKTAHSYLALYRKVRKSRAGMPTRNLFAEQSLVIRGGIYALAFGVLSKFFGFLWRLFAARLGAFQFGIFSIAWSYVEILSSLAVLGLPIGIIRFVSFYKQKGRLSKLVGVLRISLGIVLSAGFSLFFFAFVLKNVFFIEILNRPDVLPVFTILVFALPFVSLSEIALAAINAAGKVKSFFFAKSIAPSFMRFVSLLLLLLFWERSANSIAVSVLFFAVAMFMASFLIILRTIPSLLTLRHATLDRDFLRFSFPVSIAHIIQSFSRSIDIILLSLFLSPSDVGVYAAAYIFLPVIRILPESFLEFFSSAFTSAVARKKDSFSFFVWVVKLIFFLSVPLLTVLLLARKLIVGPFLPQDFSQTSFILAILSAAFFIRWVVVLPSRKVIDNLGRTDIALGLTIVEALLQIILGIVLIRVFGIVGAAAMMLVVFAASAVLTLLVIWGLYSKRIALKLPNV